MPPDYAPMPLSSPPLSFPQATAKQTSNRIVISRDVRMHPGRGTRAASLKKKSGHIHEGPVLHAMRILIVLLLLAGCSVEEASVSETTQNVSKDELEAAGADCNTLGPTQWQCFVCEWIVVTDPETLIVIPYRLCVEYRCTQIDPWGGTECEEMPAYWVNSTLGRDLNYWFEAESGTRSGPLGGLQITSSASASAGRALDLGAGTSRLDNFYVHIIPVQLTPWVRVIAPSTASNSFYLQVDNVSKRFEVPVSTTWTWVRLDEVYDKGAGWHSLRIHADEPGLRIDRILLTASPAFTPVVQTVQAEAFGWVPPMTSGIMKALPPALPTTYIWVPNGAGTGGFAQLEVDTPYGGNFVVWGRFNAPSTADNSIYIAEYLEDRVTWDVPTTSAGGWVWDRAEVAGEPLVLSLDPGAIIEVAQREDGTRLDKLVFTNDPGFTLVE